jgi:hypothetical protein
VLVVEPKAMGGTDTSAAWQASVTACTVVMWGTRPTDDPSSPNLGHDTAYTQSRNREEWLRLMRRSSVALVDRTVVPSWLTVDRAAIR